VPYSGGVGLQQHRKVPEIGRASVYRALGVYCRVDPLHGCALACCELAFLPFFLLAALRTVLLSLFGAITRFAISKN
jgi:hypothetical protein